MRAEDTDNESVNFVVDDVGLTTHHYTDEEQEHRPGEDQAKTRHGLVKCYIADQLDMNSLRF